MNRFDTQGHSESYSMSTYSVSSCFVSKDKGKAISNDPLKHRTKGQFIIDVALILLIIT